MYLMKKIYSTLLLFALSVFIMFLFASRGNESQLELPIDQTTELSEIEMRYPVLYLSLKETLFDSGLYSDSEIFIDCFFPGIEFQCKRENPFGYCYYLLVDHRGRPYFIFVDEENRIRDIHYPKNGFPSPEDVEFMVETQSDPTEQIIENMRCERQFLALYSIQTTDGVYVISFASEVYGIVKEDERVDALTRPAWNVYAFYEDHDIQGILNNTQSVASSYILPMDRNEKIGDG